MKKLQGSLLISFLAASCFCIFGQDMAYFLSEHAVPLAPVYYLTGLTVAGIFLYVVSGILLLVLTKRHKTFHNHRELYAIVLFTVAPAASLWAFFVTAMWWG
ncbi:hypothetical protein PO902_09840 [Planococcus maritimus]|nr:hypothetical protein [Planococcus sp. SK3692]MDE4085323.1 hypothetical protein [Planococcus maritimus]